MPYSGGNYTLPSNSWNPAVADTAISPGDWNQTAADLETALSTVVTKDGQTTTTAAIPFAQGLTLGAGTDVLSVYDEGTWTPTVTFSTPGTLSISYSSRSGRYTRIGDLVYLDFEIIFTPTLGTASGTMLIQGLPVAASSASGPAGGAPLLSSQWKGWTAGSLAMALSGTTALRVLYTVPSGGGSTSFSSSNLTDGAAHTIAGSIWYKA
jgi:hypothetical protein